MSNGNKTYEAMFVLDSSGADFEAASQPVRNILDRSEAEVLALKPWDDRRLAYEIKGRRRGLYALAHFSVDPSKIVEIEHDCLLAEQVLRILVLAKDHLTDEELNAVTPLGVAARRIAEASHPKPMASDTAAESTEQQETKEEPTVDSDTSPKPTASDAAVESAEQQETVEEPTVDSDEDTSARTGDEEPAKPDQAEDEEQQNT